MSVKITSQTLLRFKKGNRTFEERQMKHRVHVHDITKVQNMILNLFFFIYLQLLFPIVPIMPIETVTLVTSSKNNNFNNIFLNENMDYRMSCYIPLSWATNNTSLPMSA